MDAPARCRVAALWHRAEVPRLVDLGLVPAVADRSDHGAVEERVAHVASVAIAPGAAQSSSSPAPTGRAQVPGTVPGGWAGAHSLTLTP